jgi:hypothetical protein
MGGGTLARELDREGAGLSVSGGAAELASAVGDLLSDEDRRGRLAQAARRFAGRHTWPEVAAPLASWCRGARVDPGRRPFPEPPEPGRWKKLRKRVLRRSGRADG